MMEDKTISYCNDEKEYSTYIFFIFLNS